jgi:hypothetical protein
MRRTGIGEEKVSRPTAGPPLALLPQPITFRTVTVKVPGAPVVSLINSCRNPTTLTAGGAVIGVSIIGNVAIDLLVVTSCPESAPLSAVIWGGELPADSSDTKGIAQEQSFGTGSMCRLISQSFKTLV